MGGVSNGVVIDTQYEAHHTIYSEEGTDRSQNSKYTFSYMDDVADKLLLAVRDGRNACFIGLPCQCAAVRTFFDSNRESVEKLYLVDLACHGVPSGDYLNQHIRHINDKYAFVANDVCFRNHDIGTKKAYFFTLKDESEKIRYKKAVWNDDNFQIAYHSALMYRDNCYRCRYACEHRIGDITLADAPWLKNIKETQRDYFKGVSCILINSDKGLNLFKRMIEAKYIEASLMDIETAKGNITQLRKPSVPALERDLFLNEYSKSHDFDMACKKALRKQRAKRRLISWIKPNIAAALRNEKKLGE